MGKDEINSSALVPIVIPSYEPDDRLITLLNALNGKDMGPVIIVNDGSSEEYDHIFEQAEALIKERGGRLISYRPNRGKGRALKTAFEYIRDNMPGALGCVTADSDGQHTPGCISEIISSLKEHPDDLILGVREFNKKEIPWKSWFGNTITIKVFAYVSGMKVSDTQSGLRGIPFKFMTELIDCKGERFEYETMMLLECAGRYGLTEIPIKTVYDSKENHQTHFDPFKDSIRIYRILGRKFIKFVFASLSSFIIDILLFHLFVLCFKEAFPLLFVSIATVGARVISAVYNYLINYKFVFRSRASKGASLTKYALLAIIQMCLSAGIVSLIVFLLPVINETVIKCIVDTLLFLVSYTVQQKLVFSSKEK
ncbi:bifunctional glycosyltransferase family 2/GtrA family protein [Butyrivibrio sp. AE2032]|uniref:bifunctional glycosyltransferase family 2/GtrA family protein n=1 Tax=Butyrivibrio sp. AE2032 TaxID=1458463 RepID=UPI000556A9C3|nr:bifunctional glycosyltransferase family 2/GtrA family protein [Butyrivibrio sp. AE2032]